MPTIVDTLAIELSLDPRQLEKGLSSVVEKVKTTRDDYERHAKAFEAVAAGLLRVLGPLAAAILGITSAIEAIDWTKHASAATTEFSNLAEVIGMNVSVLAAWKQAAEAAGAGGARAVEQTFNRQQQTMRTMLPGGSGLKDLEFQQGLQHYFGLGGADVSKYLDKNGNFDLDRFNKDIASASQRLGENASQRQQWMEKLYITHPGQLSLYKNREALEKELKHQMIDVGVLDQHNADAMKKIHKDWTEIGYAAENLRIQIVTGLVDPLHAGLIYLRDILVELKNWLADPDNKTWLNPKWWEGGGGVSRQPPAWMPDWMLTPEERTQRPSTPAPTPSTPSAPTTPSTPAPAPSTPSAPTTPSTPAPALPSTPAPVPAPTPAPPTSFGGGGMPILPPPATSVPSISPSTNFGGGGMPILPPPATSVPSVPPPATSVPSAPSSLMPMILPGSPHSSIDPGLLGLPHTAAMFSRGSVASMHSRSINTNSNVTIGAMSFHATTGGTELSHAPAGSERTLSIGAYAVEANSSLV